jgi:microcystin-dependent protein
LSKSSASDYVVGWTTPVTSGDLALKANLESPTFTGTPTLPTGTIATTQTAGNSTTAIATTAFVGTAIANLVDSAPTTLNTLDELAAALGDDANFATTTATAIGLKAPLASPALTGTPTAPTAAVGTNTTQIATTAFVQIANPTGAIVAFAGSSAPSGWLMCDGRSTGISRTTYAGLFAVIGTTYGSGDGSTTFNLPDLRGRVIAGEDDMGGTAANRLTSGNSGISGTTLGAAGGDERLHLHSHANTLTNNAVTSGGQSQTHTHTGTTNNQGTNHAHSYTTVYLYTGNVDYGNYYNGYYPTGSTTGINDNSHAHSFTSNVASQDHTHSVTSNVTISNANSGAGGSQNVQPTIILNYIIKA